MNDVLRAMRERALIDPAFRRAILETAENPEPLAALCDVAQKNGFHLTLADIHLRRRGVFLQSDKIDKRRQSHAL